MHCSAQYVKDQNYVRITASGAFSAEDQLQMMEEILASDYWQKGMSVLFDCRQCKFEVNSLQVIKEVSENRRKKDAQIGGGKSALLMKSLTDHARARQYQLLTEFSVSATYRVFMDEEAALRWLLD